ncbi:hypothetical protein [Lysinibacillus fusiformis]|uniref:hypothetical protein n=1 Tax=Lysinibacillus fusiformis TaxID=28031 RepID=UPI0018821D44|nr:hypothetical protein [Lysinibacillus fusiformis]MBD8523893.1 hypothetical protein [Lysinibacillus fusiformis]
MEKILTINLEVSMNVNKGVSNENLLTDALRQINAIELKEIAKIASIRDANELTMEMVDEGLIIESAEYGTGIVIEKKMSRRYPLGIMFTSGKHFQFSSTEGMKQCNSDFEDIRCKHLINEDYHVGTTGYLVTKDNKNLPVINVPTRSKEKYKLLPVYYLSDGYPGVEYSVTQKQMNTHFKLIKTT